MGVFSSQGTRRLSLTRPGGDEFSRDAAGPRTEAARKIRPSADAVRETRTCSRILRSATLTLRELLGYTRAVDNPKRYTISREKHVQANGKFADAVLGEFGPEGKRYVAAVEGKGPKDPLDRPFSGRKVSAVDQAFDYAIRAKGRQRKACEEQAAHNRLHRKPLRRRRKSRSTARTGMRVAPTAMHVLALLLFSYNQWNRKKTRHWS